jgi:hypothetical protein
MDKETQQLAADVLESIRQMKRGEFAQVHTPEAITARRGRRYQIPCQAAPRPRCTCRPARHRQRLADTGECAAARGGGEWAIGGVTIKQCTGKLRS